VTNPNLHQIAMKITTRIPNVDEKEFIKSVHHQGYHDVVEAQFGAWDIKRQDAFFEKKWCNAALRILVAEGSPCGFVIVERDDIELRLIELVVHPVFQGRGIGSAFLESFLNNADEHKTPVKLQVLLKNRAQTLYRRMGFREYDRTHTHILMERSTNGDKIVKSKSAAVEKNHLGNEKSK